MGEVLLKRLLAKNRRDKSNITEFKVNLFGGSPDSGGDVENNNEDGHKDEDDVYDVHGGEHDGENENQYVDLWFWWC